MILTELAIKKLQPAEQSYTVFDDQLNGFGIRVGKRRKTFTVLIGHDRKRVNLGQYPDKTLSEARGEAKKLLAGLTPTHSPYRRLYGLPNGLSLAYSAGARLPRLPCGRTVL